MELMPSCPHCGCTLNFFDHYNHYNDGGTAFFFARRDCPQCYRNYTWSDVYVVHHFEDLEEDK